MNLFLPFCGVAANMELLSACWTKAAKPLVPFWNVTLNRLWGDVIARADDADDADCLRPCP